MKLVYFASVRERIGRSEEELQPPADVIDVAGLVAWLMTLGDGYQAAFACEGAVRAAIDHAHVRPDAPIGGAREIAFFPPMTGG